MDRDDDGVALRRAVADRLQKFFADWTAQLAASTAQIWDGVQRRLSERPPDAPPPTVQMPPPGRHMPMQQQQAQQQQSKIESDDKA